MTIAASSDGDRFAVEVFYPAQPVFLGGAIDQMVELDDRDIDPDWLAQVVELVECAENIALTDGAHIAAQPTTVAVGLSSTYTDPVLLEKLDQIPAKALVLMMKHLSRMESWVQATQTMLIAAFSRPGVAVPLEEVMDAVASSLSSTGTELDATILARAASTRAVIGDEAWDLTVADQAGRIAAAEIGPALNLAPITARNRVVEAQTFADDLPLTHEKWRQGRLDRVHAGIIAERTSVLDRAGKADVEHRLWGSGVSRDAGRLTPGRLRSTVDRTVIQADPEAARRRSERSQQERSVHITPRDDDMARFAADVRSPVALLAREVLDTAARNLPAACRGDRTLPQLRADVFDDIFTSLAAHGTVDIRCPADSRSEADPSAADADPARDSRSSTRTRRHEHRAEAPTPLWVPLGSSIAVTVAASTLAGFDDNPALLAGYGCITADLARSLAVSARRAAIIIERSTSSRMSSTVPRSISPHGAMAPGPRTGAGTQTAAAAGADAAAADGTGGPIRVRAAQRCAPSGEHAPGCPPELDFGREVYRPPAALRELVLQRDRTCRFPGCAQPSRRCDLDHRIPFCRNASDADTTVDRIHPPGSRTVSVNDRIEAAGSGANAPGRIDPAGAEVSVVAGSVDAAGARIVEAEGGTTCPCNLDLLCRFHHRVKTFTAWSAVRLPGNTLAWTSPWGFRYVDEVEPPPSDRWPAEHAAPPLDSDPGTQGADPPPF